MRIVANTNPSYTRESLINPSPWNEADDPALYYYLLDLEENRPGAES
jgi:hypothetical protein